MTRTVRTLALWMVLARREIWDLVILIFLPKNLDFSQISHFAIALPPPSHRTVLCRHANTIGTCSQNHVDHANKSNRKKQILRRKEWEYLLTDEEKDLYIENNAEYQQIFHRPLFLDK